MIGTLLAVVIVFVVLFVVTRSIGYYRGSFSVVGGETAGSSGARHSAAVGAGAGLIVLALLAVLWVGVMRWDWFGHPQPKAAPVVVQKVQPSPGLGGVGVSPGPSAAPSGVPSPSPQR